MSKVLVTGGAGYIGSHIVRMLVESGREVVVVDNLSEGHREALGDVPLTVADFGNAATLEKLLADGSVEFIVHMAALCEVGQSVATSHQRAIGKVAERIVAMMETPW